MLSLLLLTFAYLLGSVPSGILVARAMRLPDPRVSGSGSFGPSNLFRIGGPKAGSLTFACDFLKGFVPVLVALVYWPSDPFPASLAALLAITGHCYSVFLLFRGGKGVVTLAGALFPLAPLAMLVAVASWALAFSAFRHYALAALLTSFALLGALFALKADPLVIGVAALGCGMVVRHHRQNLEMLLKGSACDLTA